jgi:hypothetical protein
MYVLSNYLADLVSNVFIQLNDLVGFIVAFAAFKVNRPKKWPPNSTTDPFGPDI